MQLIELKMIIIHSVPNIANTKEKNQTTNSTRWQIEAEYGMQTTCG